MSRFDSLIQLVLCFITAAAAAQTPSGVGIERAWPRLRFERPVFITGAGDGSGRVFVVEQDGRIRVFDGRAEDPAASTSFLDISDRVSRKHNEEGLLGLAFHPRFAQNGEFFVHYSAREPDQTGVVARFRVDAHDPHRADAASERRVLSEKQPFRNHNGGMIAFGPDGHLYVSFGDGGFRDDPKGAGQDRSTWAGSILRVGVDTNDGSNYDVPADNPFVGVENVRPEIWAFGLRNVWRFSFDRSTGDLWAGDIGQDRFEEIDLIVKGGNYGWRRFEADLLYKPETPLSFGEHRPPIASYSRGDGISVTGGYVYRGKRHPSLAGSYFYADYASGLLWRLRKGADGAYATELARRTGRSVSSFGEDDDGELFLTSFDGGIYRIVPSDSPADALAAWPRKLSETEVFAAAAFGQESAQVVSYTVRTPFWSDGVDKSRWMALPEGKKLVARENGAWEVPSGAVFVKQFTIPTRRGRRPIETRLIRRTDSGWEAGTYVWDGRGADAELAPEGRQFEIPRGRAMHSWPAPSAAECARCHVESQGFVLGLTTDQLDVGGGDAANQLDSLVARGLVDATALGMPRKPSRLVDPFDDAAPLEARARAWLDVNCAFCHQPSGGGNAQIDLRLTTPLAATGLIDALPGQGEFGIAGARLVAPGKPQASILLHRVATLGDGRMPNLASNAVDERAVRLLAAWIESLSI